MHQDEVEIRFAAYLAPFGKHLTLRTRVLAVLSTLPAEVIRDFVEDDRFQVSLDNYQPGIGSRVWMASPSGASESSRSVVLKPRLNEGSTEFACYVVAHEFAHAYLRNGGWGEIEDPELAADALAARWGFDRPPYG